MKYTIEVNERAVGKQFNIYTVMCEFADGSGTYVQGKYLNRKDAETVQKLFVNNFKDLYSLCWIEADIVVVDLFTE